MKGHRNVIAWLKACAATLLLVSPLAAERLIVHTYSVVDGLPSDRIVRLVTDRDGFLWVRSSGGLSRFDGSQFVNYGTANGLPDPVVNHFDFGPIAPLRFQVRLDGVDDEWSQPTSQSTVLYGGLGPGRYRFQVHAVSATGQVGAEPATVDFTIPPPVWRRAWFIATISAVLAGALFAAHRLRMQRVLELERVRTRIAADLHDDLGASLARVSLLSEATRRELPNRPERAQRMLDEIGTTSRELVTAAGDIAFSIDPGRGRLDGLVARLRRFTEDLLADTGIDWRFTVEGEMDDVVLSSDQRRHLLAIVKEALHNAVRHGRPRHVSLTFARRGDDFEVELADDGRGFRTEVSGNGPAATAGNGRAPQASSRRARQAGNGRRPQAGNGRDPETGHGLRNMRDRAGELRARLEITSRPGGGTRVSLRCPLRSRHRMIMR